VASLVIYGQKPVDWDGKFEEESEDSEEEESKSEEGESTEEEPESEEGGSEGGSEEEEERTRAQEEHRDPLLAVMLKHRRGASGEWDNGRGKRHQASPFSGTNSAW